MKLTILLNTDCPQDFITWLVRRIKHELYANIDRRELERLRKHFEGVDVDIYRAVMLMINSITFKVSKDMLVIAVDAFKVFPGTSYTLFALCKLMSYGCLDFKGYNLFTEEFNRVTTNLTKYYKEYLIETRRWSVVY